ncbi:MAG: PadR family transcriptional regulator [Actinomycetota bacterium]
MASEGSRPLSDAVAEAAQAAESAQREAPATRPRGRPSDVFGGEIRRRDVFPLLVLHLIRKEPSYGNHLIEAIEEITQGVVSVNPNTMYPLLRELESNGMIEGKWEHPDRRTRRFYEITKAGEKEYKRLIEEVEPFLDSVIRSVTLIKREVYGGGKSG